MNEINLIRLSFVAATIIIAFLLVIVLLLIKKGNKIAHFFLIASVIIHTSGCFSSLLMFSGAYKYIPTLVLINYPFVFILGAIYYFYIQILINKKLKFKAYYVVHIIPLLWGFYQIKWFFPLAFDEKVNTLTQLWFGEYTLNFKDFIHYSVPNFITITYLITSFFLISKTAKKLKNTFSNTDIEYFYWLKKFTIIYIVLVLTDSIRLALTVKFGWDPGEGEIITNLLISALIQFYIFQTIKNPERVFYKLTTDKNIKVANKQKNHTDTDRHFSKIDVDFSTKLSTFMEEEKPYLNPELKSHELAIMLGVTPHYLSKKINQEFNVNFYNFINQYRVEEFKNKVLKNEHRNLTLNAIAQNVGFNSKSSFNRIFKSLTLITPTEYLKQNLQHKST